VPSETERTFVLTVEAVKRSLDTLVALKAHENLAGYLCLLFTANSVGTPSELRPDFKGFFELFLKVGGTSSRKPYLLPFRARADAQSLLFNANVAGSYAPSSLRPVSPLRQLINIQGASRTVTYSLLDGHVATARRMLLHGGQIPVCALAAFLYRDFGIVAEGRPTATALIESLIDDFGYALEISPGAAFPSNGLFKDDSLVYREADFREFDAESP